MGSILARCTNNELNLITTLNSSFRQLKRRAHYANHLGTNYMEPPDATIQTHTPTLTDLFGEDLYRVLHSKMERWWARFLIVLFEI
jgi:hypothetical protein